MAGGRPIIALVSFILLAAAILFQFFVILSGATNGDPEPKFWFLAADTSGMGDAPDASAWTFFALCPISNINGGTTFNCRPPKPALPFSPPQNFGSQSNIPPGFLGTHRYYYLSRFMFAFYLIAIFFSVVGLLTGLLALCTRLGSYLSGAMTFLAMFFQALAAALMTAWTVQGRNAFKSNNRQASLGKYAYGFTWAAFAALFVSTILFCVAGAVGKEKASKPSRWNAFGRKRSTKSRGSFRGERVKDDYS